MTDHPSTDKAIYNKPRVVIDSVKIDHRSQIQTESFLKFMPVEEPAVNGYLGNTDLKAVEELFNNAVVRLVNYCNGVTPSDTHGEDDNEKIEDYELHSLTSDLENLGAVFSSFQGSISLREFSGIFHKVYSKYRISKTEGRDEEMFYKSLYRCIESLNSYNSVKVES